MSAARNVNNRHQRSTIFSPDNISDVVWISGFGFRSGFRGKFLILAKNKASTVDRHYSIYKCNLCVCIYPWTNWSRCSHFCLRQEFCDAKCGFCVRSNTETAKHFKLSFSKPGFVYMSRK